MSGPHPIIGMRRRQRTNGAPYLVGIVDRELVIPAGAEIHMRRLHDGRLTSPEFALQVVPPKAVVTKKAIADARDDRLDGAAIRDDGRDGAAPRTTP